MDVPSAPVAQQSERRIVSVLFADLVGFTTLAEGLDPEDLASIQDAYFAAVREVIGRYRGQLEKFIGDAAMAVFGTPRSNDDDAVRAVLAGVALINATSALSARLGLESGELRLRVGVNSGEVLVTTTGPDEGRVSGDTVNVAARLQTAAPPNGVLVGELTALQVAHAVELEPAEPLALKGKTLAVRASHVVGIRAEPSRELAMGHLRTDLVGREEELETLSAAASRASSGGTVRVLVVAPPGVGKTRLADEAAGRLERAGWRVVRVRRTADATPYQPIVRLLLAAGDVRPGTPDAAAVLAGAIDEVLPVPRASVVARDVVALVTGGAPASGERTAMFTSWLDALDALTGGRPNAWFIDDLHAAGADLLAFLDAAASRDVPRLIVATARPILLDDLDRGPEAGGGAWEIVDLPTLTHGTSMGFVASLVGDALPPDLAARVVAASDGNCLFIEELLRTWVAVGVLARDGDRWGLTVDAAQVALPQSVQAIYAAQLDDLPDAPRAVARRASVAGRRFPVGAFDALDLGPSAGGLETLRRRALVAGPTDAGPLGAEYAYRHALLRDAGYATLGRSERADLHVRLAQWLEAAARDGRAELAADIGRHYANALQAAPSLATSVGAGLDRAAVLDRATHWLDAAAEHDMTRFAMAAAAAAWRRALSLTPPGDALALARRQRRLGDALVPLDLDEAVTAYAAAVEAASSLVEAPGPDNRVARGELSRAASRAAGARYEQIRFDEALATADAGLRLLRGSAEPGVDLDIARLELVRLRAREGIDNDYATLAAEADALVSTLPAGADPALVFEAKRTALMFASNTGVASAEDWTGIAAEAEQLARWDVAAGALTNAATFFFEHDRAEAARALDRAEDITERFALHDRAGWIGQARTELGLVTGDWPAAIAVGRRTFANAIERHHHRIAVRTMAAVTPIAHARRDEPLLQASSDWCTSWLHIFPGSPYGTVLQHAVELRLAEAGVPPARLIDLARLDEGLGIADDSGSWASSVETIVRSRLLDGRIDEAERAVARYSGTSTAVPVPLRDASIALCRAWLLQTQGRDVEALVEAAAAARHATAADAPWWILRALEVADDPATHERRQALRTTLGVVINAGVRPSSPIPS